MTIKQGERVQVEGVGTGRVIAVVNGLQGDPSDPTVGARAVVVRARVIALPEVAEAGRAPYIFLAANRQGIDLKSFDGSRRRGILSCHACCFC